MWTQLRSYAETDYLTANPDVAGAVRGGSFASGLQHYLLHGQHEGRSGVRVGFASAIDRWRASANAFAWPPAEYRLRVHGDEDLANFTWLGERLTVDLFVALHGAGLLVSGEGAVLDFGVGCGRVARWWATSGAGALAGSDIDPETVGWCTANLGEIATFSVNPYWPPLALDDASIDLVFAISVFTHLPQDMELAWIAELARVTKPGGILLLTSHGLDLFAGDSADGFVYSEAGGADGLPDFYRTSFHTEADLRSKWGEFVEIVDVLPKAINGHQDLVIARRSSGASATA